MKITTEHYEFLESKITNILGEIKRHSEYLKSDLSVKNHTTRLMWDAFHAIKVYNTYSYKEFHYMDSHIETAMKSIFKKLSIA